MQLTIERPKDINLEELLELRIWIAPCYHGDERMPRKRIVIGQTDVRWVATETVTTDGAILIFKDHHHEYMNYIYGAITLFKDDTIVLTLNWENF